MEKHTIDEAYTDLIKMFAQIIIIEEENTDEK